MGGFSKQGLPDFWEHVDVRGKPNHRIRTVHLSGVPAFLGKASFWMGLQKYFWIFILFCLSKVL